MKMQQWITQNLKKDQHVLITGTTTGIGREYALEFAKMGCNLICVSNEEEALAQQKAEMESTYKIRVTNFVVDLRDVEATKRVAAEIAQLPIGVLINNAGVGVKGYFEKNSIDTYLDLISINVKGPLTFTHAILPQMKKNNNGFIIHVASINAFVPIPCNQAYTATKAFIFNFSSALSRENKDTGIRFQVVLPGTTRTPFHDRQGARPSASAMMPEDVVKASLNHAHRAICIPNRADKLLAKFIPFMPRTFAMDLASYLLKKRLGL